MRDAHHLQEQTHSVRRGEAPCRGRDFGGLGGMLAARELRRPHADAEAGEKCALVLRSEYLRARGLRRAHQRPEIHVRGEIGFAQVAEQRMILVLVYEGSQLDILLFS